MDARNTFITGLRALADFLETHPAVPTPTCDTTFNIFVNSREELTSIARTASWSKKYDNTWFMLARTFGDLIRFEVNIYRDTICRKVVTGTRLVPAVEAQPAREEDVYEWVCDDVSLLAGDQTATV